MTATMPERPVLRVVPPPAPPTPPADAVPMVAARVALEAMLSDLGVEMHPNANQATRDTADALLVLLLQASGATVTTNQATADRAQWLGAVAGLSPVVA